MELKKYEKWSLSIGVALLLILSTSWMIRSCDRLESQKGWAWVIFDIKRQMSLARELGDLVHLSEPTQTELQDKTTAAIVKLKSLGLSKDGISPEALRVNPELQSKILAAQCTLRKDVIHTLLSTAKTSERLRESSLLMPIAARVVMLDRELNYSLYRAYAGMQYSTSHDPEWNEFQHGVWRRCR